jgi:hypothetical protein
LEEVTDEPLYRDRVCGFDIGKAQMAATIRVPSEENPARQPTIAQVASCRSRGYCPITPVITQPTPAVIKCTLYRVQREPAQGRLTSRRRPQHPAQQQDPSRIVTTFPDTARVGAA